MLARLKSLLHATPKPVPTPALAPRERGLEDEVTFWRHWFQTKGDQWPADYNRRFDPALELQEELAVIARRHPSTTLDILDVGAGPVTRLGKHLEGKQIRLVATDYLAPQYNKLIDELGVTPLVRTQFADAEKLVELFGTERFDIVHAQNCVDHMERAALAMEQMIDVLRPGGTLYLRHEENEGKHAQYGTIHHWDFWLDDTSSHFFIKHVKGEPIDVTTTFAGRGTSRAYREGKRVVYELTKA